MRIFVDTNILVSAIVFMGPEYALFDKPNRFSFEAIISDSVLDETREVLEEKFPFESKFIELFVEKAGLQIIEKNAYEDQIAQQNVRDEKDRHVLAAALSAGCEIIVTGDKDLLCLKEHKGIRIMRTRELLKKLKTG